jgi:hypothetical protein
MSYTLSEQETTVTVDRDERLVRVFTTIPAHIRRLSKDDRYTTVQVGNDGIGDFGRFTTTSDWNPISGTKRVRVLTSEQRQEIADRFKK